MFCDQTVNSRIWPDFSSFERHQKQLTNPLFRRHIRHQITGQGEVIFRQFIDLRGNSNRRCQG